MHSSVSTPNNSSLRGRERERGEHVFLRELGVGLFVQPLVEKGSTPVTGTTVDVVKVYARQIVLYQTMHSLYNFHHGIHSSQ